LRFRFLIREFKRLSGSTIRAQVGEMMTWDEISGIADRKDLLRKLYDAVFTMQPPRKRTLLKAG